MKKEIFSVVLDKKFRREFFDKAISQFGSQLNLAKYLNSKIKNRKILRENIKDWIKGKHVYGWYLFIPLEILKELSRINSINLDVALSHAVKFNPSWKDPKNRIYLVKEIPATIIEKEGIKYLDLSSVVPKETLNATRSGKKHPLFCKIDNEEIELWSEANWKRSSIKLNRLVKLDDLFFIGSAIYSSEGITKVGKFNDSISIGNSEPEIINLFLKWLNSFLKDYKFNCRIEFNGPSCDPKQLVNFWKNAVPFIRKHEVIVRKRKEFGSSLINNMGVLQLKISNTVLKSFIVKLLNNVKVITLLKKDYSIAYLKGLLASEGSVSRPKLKMVSVGCTNKYERMFIKNLLNKLQIKFTEGKNQFAITGWTSFFFLYNNNIFSIPQVNGISKESVFYEGLKHHQTTEAIMRLKKFKDIEFTALDWQDAFKLKYYISAHSFLKRLVNKDLLKFKFDNGTKIYFINQEKSKFLEKIWNMISS